MTSTTVLKRCALLSTLLLITLASWSQQLCAVRYTTANRAITYPLEETVTVKFRGTTLLPRLKGEAKVRRAGRRGTRVELSIDDLPRASELGGIYTTYILWAISPDGHVDNLGEIKRSGSSFVNSKLDVTTPLQTFAMILTAEPHFLMKVPSRMVVMENLPPQRVSGSQIETVNVQYIGNSSDYFRNVSVPEIADRDYRETPVSLLGADRPSGLRSMPAPARTRLKNYACRGRVAERRRSMAHESTGGGNRRPRSQGDFLGSTCGRSCRGSTHGKIESSRYSAS